MSSLKPEKVVQNLVYPKSFQLGMSLDLCDSKGVYSEKQGRYSSSTALKNGFPDLTGCDKFGHYVAIELKAFGERNLCSLDQWNFLKRKIEHNSFCLVCDCSNYLETVYNHWLSLDPSARRDYLKSLLPKKVYIHILISKKRTRKIISAPAL